MDGRGMAWMDGWWSFFLLCGYELHKVVDWSVSLSVLSAGWSSRAGGWFPLQVRTD